MKRILLYMIVLLMMLYAMTSCNPYGSQIPERLNGCWVSRDNGRWEYGFFEEFAICNNNFWRYYSVSDDEIVLYSKGAAAHTKNNGKQLGIALDSTAITLKISFEGDSILNVNGKRYWQFNTPYELKGTADGLSQIAHNDFEKLIDYPNTQPDTADFDATAQGNAVIMIYERNTAQGIESFGRRFDVNKHDLYDFYNPDDTASWTKFVGKPVGGVTFNSRTDFPNYMSPGTFFPKNIDFDEHYGERYVFNVQVNGVAEFSLVQLLRHLSYPINFATYIVEPGDTLMLFLELESVQLGLLLNHHHVMGTNERFCREVDAFYNDIIWNVNTYNTDGLYDDWNRQQMSDTAYFEQRLKRYAEDSALLERYLTNCPIPMSKKFVRFSRNQLLYNFAADIANNALADDYLAQKYSQLNEDDLYLSADALNFADKLIVRNSLQLCGDMPVTRENLERHPDFIIYGRPIDPALLHRMGITLEQPSNVTIADKSEVSPRLINPKVLKDLGLSDKFIEDYRFCSFRSFMTQGRTNRWTGDIYKINDYEIDNIMRNITNESYREQLKLSIESHQQIADSLNAK